jgi:hypothetical protein
MGVKGKYFLIVNKPTGLVLDVKGASHNAGTEVIVWDRHGNDNQVWYQDPLTGTIRNKHSHLCLDINGSNRLVVNHYQPGDPNQQWHYDKHRKTIGNRTNSNKVLDIVKGATHKGAEVCQWDHHGNDNQKWKIEPLPVKYFFIKSALNDKVLSIEGASKSHGAKVVMHQQGDHSADNQLWFEDFYGNIRSKLNQKLVLDASSGAFHTGEFEEDHEKRLFWCIEGNKIVNRYNTSEVLDIKGENRGDGAELCAWKYHSGNNQHWHFEYV